MKSKPVVIAIETNIIQTTYFLFILLNKIKENKFTNILNVQRILKIISIAIYFKYLNILLIINW